MTMFDCLHDMGDPVGAARHVRETLAPDGTWMIVEPAAGDRVEDNLNPVGRAYYGFSTLLCTPASLSQEVGLALGAQAGEARIRDVVLGGRLHALPPRRGDAVQPRVRGAAVSDADDRPPSSRCSEPRRARRPQRRHAAARADARALPGRGGLRRARRRAPLLRGLRRGRGDDLPDADVVARALAPLEDADPLPGAPLPRAHDGRSRQRPRSDRCRDPRRYSAAGVRARLPRGDGRTARPTARSPCRSPKARSTCSSSRGSRPSGVAGAAFIGPMFPYTPSHWSVLLQPARSRRCFARRLPVYRWWGRMNAVHWREDYPRVRRVVHLALLPRAALDQGHRGRRRLGAGDRSRTR